MESSSITVPLLFEVYKPKERLKPADIYRSKPEIAAVRELKAMGFRFKLVLADSLYGESGCGFINVLYELKLDFGDSQQSRGLVAVSKRFAAIDGASLSACSAMVKLSFVIFENYFWAPHSTIRPTRDVAKECNGV